MRNMLALVAALSLTIVGYADEFDAMLSAAKNAGVSYRAALRSQIIDDQERIQFAKKIPIIAKRNRYEINANPDVATQSQFSFANAKMKQAAIEQLKERIRTAKRILVFGKEAHIPEIDAEFQQATLHDIATISRGEVWVSQALENGKFLGEIIPRSRERASLIMFSGLDKAIVDDQSVSLPGIVFRVGEYRYQSVTGTRTVPHYKILSDEERAKLNSMIDELPSNAPSKVWEDLTGSFSIEAKLVDYQDGKVTLSKASGERVDVLVSKLSKEDQKLIKSLFEPE